MTIATDMVTDEHDVCACDDYEVLETSENFHVWVEDGMRQSVVELDNVECKRLRGRIEAINVAIPTDNSGGPIAMVHGWFKARCGSTEVVAKSVSPKPEVALKILDKWLTEDQRKTLATPWYCDAHRHLHVPGSKADDG
jgi:hypothetical protein